MKFDYIKLKFKTPLHLGERESWLEGTATTIHSDTLFSAFCHCYRLLYGLAKLDLLLKRFLSGSPPFLLSSCFPYWNDSYYFPVPLNQFPKDKDMKKINYIIKSDFESLLNGGILSDKTDGLPRKIESNMPIKNIYKYPWKIIEVPRVGLNRRTNHPDERYFYFSQLEFLDNAGLYFFYDLVDKSIELEFKSVIRLMADEGIGGDRSSGKGWMKSPQFDNIELNIPEHADGILFLSLLYPELTHIPILQKGFYAMIERKGYIYSPDIQSLRRKSCRMLTEGSIFMQMDNNPIQGKFADVTPNAFSGHRVYRYGLGFGIPCRMGAPK